MKIFGIDPGVSGAICVLKEGKILEVYEMPTMIDGKKNKRQVNGAEVTNILLKDLNNDLVHKKIEESQLFLEAAHACYARLRDAETKEN